MWVRHVDSEQCEGGLLSPLITCRGAGLFYRLNLSVAFAAAVSTCIKTGSFAVTDPRSLISVRCQII